MRARSMPAEPAGGHEPGRPKIVPLCQLRVNFRLEKAAPPPNGSGAAKPPMTKPIAIDLPHRLGTAEARRRIENGIDDLERHIPGAADVSHRWTGDRLHLSIAAMGQAIDATIDVEAAKVHLELSLPPALAFFARPIEAALRRKGTDMLEDKRGEAG